MSFRLLLTVTVSQTFLVLGYLEFWILLVKCFMECPSIGICLIFFPLWIVHLYEEYHKYKEPFSSHQGNIISTCFLTVDIKLDHLAEVVLVSVLYYRVIISSPSSGFFLYCTLWKEVYALSTSGVGSLSLDMVSIYYTLWSFPWVVCFFSLICLFIYSFSVIKDS